MVGGDGTGSLGEGGGVERVGMLVEVEGTHSQIIRDDAGGQKCKCCDWVVG